MATKLTYWDKNANQKRAIRKFLLGNAVKEYNSIVTLAGPDIVRSVSQLVRMGFVSITTYEKDRKVSAKQLMQLEKLKYVLGDRVTLEIHDCDIINYTPSFCVSPYVFLDLDFCARIESVEEHISKFITPFNKAFMITVSELRVRAFSSIPKFLSIIGLREYRRMLINPNQIVVHSNVGTYLFTRYFDTSAMIVISSFNLK